VPTFGAPSALAMDVGVGVFILYPAPPAVTHPYTSVNVKACIPMTPTMKNPAYTKWVLTVKIRQPSHEFTFGVGMTFVSYPLVLTPVV
jgi:hypothetical protein